uniref:RNA-directed RNA polymerase catalytic subunit n=2 Tax=root TaxID=1 RepID=A0A3G1PW29_9ORTO|nr:PB1 [Photinus pyralis orthomyxo-like virus 2]
MINEPEFAFEEYPNTLLIETIAPDDMTEAEEIVVGKPKELDKKYTETLAIISPYYLYTGTPPFGYGTQASKVAETVLRAYSFNLKKKNRVLQVGPYEIERLQWEKEDGKFPHHETHGNFVPAELRLMVESFLKRHHAQVDDCAEKTIKEALEKNSDVLTAGRQTHCPFRSQSVTAASAYKYFFDYLTENTGLTGLTCLEWIRAICLTLENETLSHVSLEEKWAEKVKYNRVTKQRVKVHTRTTRRVKTTTKGKENVRKVALHYYTQFASYLKHKERAKKDRRAIASATMGLRMFLRIIEQFHLHLAKVIPGSTISIGGEEKKAKITNNLANDSLNHEVADTTTQGTEDATKWNECLSPGSFALMHRLLFEDSIRAKLGLPRSNEYGRLFSRVAVTGNFMMAIKSIQIGQGTQIRDQEHYSRLEWRDEHIPYMNDQTKEWYQKVSPLMTPDRQYVRASPGMLMGMLNAGSTTLGLLAANHRMNGDTMKVVTLRSSDDSMSLYLASSPHLNRRCIEMNRQNLSLIAINLSTSKTILMKKGIGEYTSWYIDEKFISQYGVETSAIRPQGKNPADDFYSIAKGTASSLQTLTVNPLGASVRLRLGIAGVRRLWRIKREIGKREGVSDKVLLLSDGGKSPWTCMNSHLEETSLREHHAESECERNYLLRVRNPENPFSEEPTPEVAFSKEMGTLVMEITETPRTVFHFTKRSNRTFGGPNQQEQAIEERSYGELLDIIRSVDPTTTIEYPKSGTNIADHLIALLETESIGIGLDEEESEMLQKAINKLKGIEDDDQVDSLDDDWDNL